MTGKVSAVLLAAGLSKRMGRPKQLLPLAGKPVIRHCLDNIISSGVEDIIVVLNAESRETEEGIRHLPLKTVFNNDPSSEMAESVRIGLKSLEKSSSGVLICLSDQPLISVDTLKTLIAWHKKEPDKIVLPVYQKRRGHPCLFPRGIAEEVFQGFTLRDIARRDDGRILLVDVPDEGILFDMDTEEDYKVITRRISEI